MPTREEIKKFYQIALYRGFKSFCFCLLIGSIFSVLFVSSGLNTHAVFAEETSDSDLREAIEAGDDSFVISGNIILTNSIEINHNIVLTGSGAIHVTGDFWHFIVNEGANLVIDGEITIEGNNIGGGILIDRGIFELVNGEIRYIGTGNQYGAVTIIGNGIFYMHGGIIHRSDIRGVLVGEGSTFHMRGGQISENFPANCHGGGVAVNGTFNMYDGIISNNRAYGRGIFGGGGVHISQYGTFNMHGGNISENTATMGGGVETFGTFNMHSGVISNNLGADGGGGISVDTGVFNMYGGTISYNESGFSGAGIRLWSGHLNLHGGNITFNKTNEGAFGGGISMIKSSLYMYGGIIQENSSNSGGGILIGGSSLAMIHGGQIKNNFAEIRGGGIFLEHNSTLTIEGGEIRNNTSLSGGGGIFVWATMDGLTVGSDVVFSGNSAESHHNIGRARGRERYPQIMWYGDNSLPGTHLLNNYDINFEGRWRPANWQIALVIGSLLGAILFIIILIKKLKKQTVTKEPILEG